MSVDKPIIGNNNDDDDDDEKITCQLKGAHENV